MSSILLSVHKLLFRYNNIIMLLLNSPAVMRSVRLVPQAISRFDKEYILRLTHHTRFCRRRKRSFFSKMFVYNKCERKTANSMRIHCVRIMHFIITTFYRYDSKRSITSSMPCNNNYIVFVQTCPVVLPCSSIVFIVMYLSQLSE